MREIQYRIWDNQLNKYWYELPQQHHIDWPRFIPEQYTGRKDFSGYKEVYEGDIVNIISDGKQINNLTVKWSNEKCGFIFENNDWNIFIFHLEHIEIIGNIHD